MKYLITGAGGFVGTALLRRQVNGDSREAIAAVYRKPTHSDVVDDRIKQWIIDITPTTDWTESVRGIDVVVHLAASAHFPLKDATDDAANTINLARQAAAAGVKRFVFLSSIGVNGSVSVKPFTEQDPPNPHNPYARAKYQAEVALRALANETALEVVIIRAPLVYGLDAPGNFATLIKLVRRKVPLPLGSIQHNRRSLVALDNLVDFILLCADYRQTPAAANQIFLIADAQDLSTAELLQKMASSLGTTPLLLPIPRPLLVLLFRLLRQEQLIDQLLSSLQIDNTKAKQLLGWSAITDLRGQLERAG